MENFKALGQITNKVISHIIEDYRIVAAIINCFYVKLFSDRENAHEIGVNMNNKIKQKKHSMEKYWNDFKDKDFMKIDSNEINDFPRLDINTLKNNITFGSYQLKNSFGYLAEHFDKNGTLNILLKKNCLKDENVLSVKIQSRHKEQTKYKIVIVYSPSEDDVSSILGWKCSCSVGNRKVGCCSHIACIIFYLSCGKYGEIKKPGYSLNGILLAMESTSESDVDTNHEESGIEEILDVDCISENQNLMKTKASLNIKRKIQVSSSFETLSIKPKNQDPAVCKLLQILPNWGGKIDTTNNCKYENFELIDTCTIDYFLLAMSFTFELNESLAKRLANDKSNIALSIHQIIQLILNNEWNRAKSIWVLQVLKLLPTRRKFSTFGEEFEFFISSVKALQLIKYSCTSCKSLAYSSDELYFDFDENMNVRLSSDERRVCLDCQSDANINKSFEKIPCWLFIQSLITSYKKNITLYDLPNDTFIDSQKYKLFMCTYLVGTHFKSIIKINDRFYAFDDLKVGLDEIVPKHIVSSCIYYIVDQ